MYVHVKFPMQVVSSYFFFQVGYVKLNPKIVNFGLYSCAPINQHLYRNCRPYCSRHYHWKSGIWPCSRYTPRRNWLAWYHTTIFWSCKMSFPPWVFYTNTRHCWLLASLFPGHSLCCRRISLYRRCSRLANVSTFSDFTVCTPRVLHVSRQLSSSILMTRILFERASSFSLVVLYFCKDTQPFPFQIARWEQEY